MIRREIAGPQDRYERSGAQALRDVRPLTARLSATLMGEFSGLALLTACGGMAFEPASVHVVVPAAILYAAIVATRRTKLPMRLPKSARVKDWNYPDPASRRPRRAAGTIYLGKDLAGKELWISSDDARQHGTIPGTTGAGKTTTILSFLTNAFTHASGFVLVDGKADSKLYGEVLALARRFGREDDVLHLNLLVASGSKESNSFNPFASGNADQIREMVVSQLGEQSAQDSNGVFRGRAVALIGSIIPALVWLRDHSGLAIDIETIRDALELRWIWKLATRRECECRDRATGKTKDIKVDIPEHVIYPLQAYLGEIPGYDANLAYDEQKSHQPREQHGYARFYFTEMFTQLGGSLGHIFKVEQGDIDMRDVVLNRRILVVSLPALENSSDSLAGLGKIVVASLRGMMAQMLHAEPESLDPAAPFQVVFDELAYYATGDLDRMLAQGRSLNIMFWLAFQEISGIVARLGEKTQTLLGNANLTVAMRQQDANRTREWIEQTAGQTLVAQASSYRGGDMQFHDSRHADVRQVARVDWGDLQRLIEGEAIILFAGRRIYAKLFYAKIGKGGPIRLKRPLCLAAPDAREVVSRQARLTAIGEGIEKGMVVAASHERAPETVEAMLKGFMEAHARGGNGEACVAAAVEAGGRHAIDSFGGAAIQTPVTAMMEQATKAPVDPIKEAGLPTRAVEAGVMRLIVGLEEAVGATGFEAKQRAFEFLKVMEKATERVAKKGASPQDGKNESKLLSAREFYEVVERVRELITPDTGIAVPVPELAQTAGMAP
jgi:intracellular multiplication protein IcmO